MQADLQAVRAEIERQREIEAKATPGPLECDLCSINNWHDQTFEMEWIPNGVAGGSINRKHHEDAEELVTARNSHDTLLNIAEAAAELRAVVSEIAAVTPDWAMAYGFTSEMRTAQEWLPKLDAALTRLVEGK